MNTIGDSSTDSKESSSEDVCGCILYMEFGAFQCAISQRYDLANLELHMPSSKSLQLSKAFIKDNKHQNSQSCRPLADAKLQSTVVFKAGVLHLISGTTKKHTNLCRDYSSNIADQ
eukprot:6047674-Amphidinium_carterae.1